MKLISFERDGRTSAGLWLGDGVLDLGLAAQLAGGELDASSVQAIIEGGDAALAEVAKLAETPGDDTVYAADSIRLLAPIPHPKRNIFCVGRNYMDHVAEGDRVRGVETKLPEWPQFFTKVPQAINHPGAEIPYFTGLTQNLDYEVELAVIIGKGGRDIAKAEAYDHVFGYTIANDVSAREVQYRHQQWFKGKSLDGSLPLGPWIVTSDEIGDPATLELSLTLNGEERQRASVSMMIFDIPTIISQLSQGMALLPGDIIATGTPSGVGFAMEPKGLMKGGDRVVCTISRIGDLANTVVEA